MILCEVMEMNLFPILLRKQFLFPEKKTWLKKAVEIFAWLGNAKLIIMLIKLNKCTVKKAGDHKYW